MKTTASWILFSSSMAVLASGANTNSLDIWTSPSCDLECANGGYCTLIDGSPEQLARKAQAGNLIEICVCQPGYTGIACENILEHCTLPERTCHNGAPCTKGPGVEEWGCDCSLADSMSQFAGHMCRKPITEYCTGKFEPNSALSFCTNGGRCVADFLAAKVAPGDTSVNRRYQHAGCACPADFSGPHCEFLQSNVMPEVYQTPGNVRTNRKVKSPATAILLALMSIGILILGALFRFKQRYMIEDHRSGGSTQDDTISVTSNHCWGESVRFGQRYGQNRSGYDESLYNGRFVCTNSPSRLDAVLEAVTLD